MSGKGTTLSLRAGDLEITAVNIGTAIHNVHIYKSKGGASVAATDHLTIAGGAIGKLKVKLEPGTYYYQCDFHTAEIFGTLTVSSG